MEFPVRKETRLKNYDYSLPGAYFVTICTENRRCIFWTDVGETCGLPNETHFSRYGSAVKRNIDKLNNTYENVFVIKYVIMPNHVHMLIEIKTDSSGRPQTAPTLSRIVNQFKGAVTKDAGKAFWQKGFYDHVIRSQNDYNEIIRYIETNPERWLQDKLYDKNQFYSE